MNEVLLIAGMTAVTFLPRYGVMALLGRVQLPEPVARALKFVPPAVLSAIILPSVLYKDDHLFLSPQNPYLIAGIVAGLVAWRSRSLLLTIVIGMVALWAWTWVLGLAG
jgi:branched-subunit amino acid transport protein